MASVDPQVTQSPTSSRDSGQLASLDEPPSTPATIQYPLDLFSQDRKHAVIFHIFKQQNSSYNVNNVLSGNVSNTADRNTNANRIGGAATTGTGAVAAIAITGAAGAVAGFVKAGTAGAAAFGAAVGAGATAAGLLALNYLDLSNKTTQLTDTIGLYMPDVVQSSYAHNWDNISTTEALSSLGLLSQGSADFTKSGKEGVPTSLGSAVTAEAEGAIASSVGLGGFKDLALFSAGYAQNPQYEMVYKSPNLRTFNFMFKLVPRNKVEAATIFQLIKKFKYNAAPEIIPGSSGRYLVPPSQFGIEFWYDGALNTNLPKISTCVLETVDVDYTSAGQWTTFSDGFPVETTLNLRFKEVEIIHKGLVDQGY